MKKINEKIIRVGDYVRIKNPMRFIRCGYPLTKDIVKNTIFTEDQKKSIIDFLETFGISYDLNTMINGKWTQYDKILDILLESYLRTHGWGGDTRSVYEEKDPEFEGLICTVASKHTVKTGKYIPGHGGYDYYNGGYDYTPAYLDNSKTHVILKVLTHGTETVTIGKVLVIDKIHVEKVSPVEVTTPRSKLPEDLIYY